VNESLSPAQLVRTVVADAARRRQSLAALRQVARWAPIVAAGLAGIALVARVAAWPGLLVIALLVAAALAAGGYLARARRHQASTDVMAAAIDHDAGFGGELRSAHWFATRQAADPWTSFHLGHAARRVQDTNWATVYPPVRATRAWIATAALTLLSVLIPFTLPGRAPFWPGALSATSAPVLSLESLPEELRQQVVDAVVAVTKGEISAEDAVATLLQSDAFNALPPDAQRQVAELLQKARLDGSSKVFAGATGEAVSAEAARWAKENLDMLYTGKDDPADPGDKPFTSEKQEQSDKRNEYTEDGASGGEGEASDFQSSTRVRMKPQGNPESSQPMPMTGAPDASGEAGSSFGGKHGDVRYGTTKASELAAAFRQEIVEADMNTNGSSRESDARRRTEQSRSALTYTRVAGQVSFDRARVDAPRSVPEARRPLVERYFVRERDDR